MNPQVLFGSKFEEDPWEFMDSIQTITKFIGITPTESADLTTY